MISQKSMNEFFERRVPMKVREELIDELIKIGYNREVTRPIKNKFGAIMTDKKGSPLIESVRPYTATSQISAIKILTEYSIGRAGAAEQEAPVSTGGATVVILPGNNR